MTKDDIIRMAREAGGLAFSHALVFDWVERFAKLIAAAESRKVAEWMLQRSYATGHGDTIEDLLQEMEWQVAERAIRARGEV